MLCGVLDMRDVSATCGLRDICPSCGSSSPRRFFGVANVPIDSCALLATREDGLRAPRGDLVASFCPACGFIWNSAYDPDKVDHSRTCEDQQCFSPTFNDFASNLAWDLIEKYDLRGKQILEIGCGKGDFLALMCSMGGNRGIGIDPSYVERGHGGRGDLIFVRDYYSRRYSDYVGDFICCRHTLEHIHNTRGFLQEIRRSIPERKETVLFFEVPDMTRILAETAFWDMYYYHCSYFTPGSLARLFRLCGFEVMDLYRGFSDQYLMIEAKPVDDVSSKVHRAEETTLAVSREVTGFSARCQRLIGRWRDQLSQWRMEGKRTAVWGAGSKCVAFMAMPGISDGIGRVIDINVHRQGKFLPGTGKQIHPPASLKHYRPHFAVVMNPIYTREIEAILGQIAVDTQIVPIHEADGSRIVC